VHRDVKPGNVLITPDGSAKVTDFGISHAFDDVTVTSTGLIVGTPAYLAPEVARGTAPDFSSDVYALGATLYLAVEGRPPFGTDDNPMAVLHRVASGQWDRPVRAGTLTPVVARMMALDRSARPSMTEVANALQRLSSAGAPGSAATTTQVMRTATTAPLAAASPTTPVRRRQRSLLLPLLTLLLVLVLGAVLTWVLLSGSGDNGNQPGAASNQTATSGHAQPTHHSPSGRTPRSTSHSTSPRTSSTPAIRSSTPAIRTSQPINPPAGGGGATAQQLAAAITQYFQLVPGNLDAGWSRLTPHFQNTRAQNQEVYDSYWNSVDHVSVSNVQGLPPNSASADLVYYYDDGRVVPQHTTFRFVRQGGILKIDQES